MFSPVERVHGDDSTVPVMAKGKTDTARIWFTFATIVRSAERRRRRLCFIIHEIGGGEHPLQHLKSYTGILQADAYGGYNKLYEPARSPGPIVEAACWSHARRKFFELADIAANARRKAQGETPTFISPMALRSGSTHRRPVRDRARD